MHGGNLILTRKLVLFTGDQKQYLFLAPFIQLYAPFTSPRQPFTQQQPENNLTQKSQ